MDSEDIVKLKEAINLLTPRPIRDDKLRKSFEIICDLYWKYYDRNKESECQIK